MPQSDSTKDSKPTIHDLGAAAFNMSYGSFRAALDLEDDGYTIDKYQQFKAIGRAMAAFGDSTLEHLVRAYDPSGIPMRPLP